MHKHMRDNGKEGQHQPRWDVMTRYWNTDGTRSMPCSYPNCNETLVIGTVQVKDTTISK